MVSVKYSGGVWRAYIDLLRAQKFWLNEIAAEFDITPQMAQAVRELPASGSMTMKELATVMWCDASNATGIIDRLEQRGLVERRPSDADRRVKCVVLTTAGKRLRRKLEERFDEPPPAIAALSEADQQTLHQILDRALAHAERQRGAE